METGWQAGSEAALRTKHLQWGVGEAMLKHMEYVHPHYLSQYIEGGHILA